MPGSTDLRTRFEAEALPFLDAAHRRACVLAGRGPDAEDLVQETFLRAFRKFHLFQPGTNLRAWLMTILTNLFLDRARRRSPRLVSLEGLEESGASVPASADPGQPREPVAARDPALSDHLPLDLRRALDSLSPTLRAVLLLISIDDLSYEETAAALDVPIGTVMSRLFRARRAMVALLGAPEFTESGVRPAGETPAVIGA
ncbi:MAG: sigma-70 family RNA polymerase sigma factor [Planctomycetes bacterium]|nr:sigma-70 family RNA polymerase sigma factor [Planctomycetota bacterium]